MAYLTISDSTLVYQGTVGEKHWFAAHLTFDVLRLAQESVFHFHNMFILCSSHSYLLVKSLSPVKDLEQLLSISFSSPVLIGGLEEKTGGRRADEVEGKDDSEEEEAELNSPSPALGFSKHSLSPSTSTSAGAPQQFMRPGPSVKSIHAPRSLAMTRFYSVSLSSCLFTSWQDLPKFEIFVKKGSKKSFECCK